MCEAPTREVRGAEAHQRWRLNCERWQGCFGAVVLHPQYIRAEKKKANSEKLA